MTRFAGAICRLVAVSIVASCLAYGQTEVDPSGLKVVWTCSTHREVTESAAGTCPIDRQPLIRTAIQEAYTCPLHAVISAREPGECPICGRALFLTTEEVRYACPMHAEVESHAPGQCPVCNMALVASTSTRPHQDHNPKKGGIFFMAPDAWHHLEGVHPEPGVFRVYLYDNFSQPLDARAFDGRAVLEEAFDVATRTTTDLEWYPLRASDDGAYLEAEVGTGDFPREITAKLRFETDGELERFDFIFPELTAPPPPEGATAEAPAASGEVGDLVVPDAPEAIVAGIQLRAAAVAELVAAGALQEIYLPALEAKDLAVALEPHVDGKPPEARRALVWALKQIVRTAWLLDDYGDLGNREKVIASHRQFAQAVEELERHYP